MIDEDDATEPIAPFTSQSAYVRGGVLVARFAFLTIKTRTPTAGNAWLALSIVMANAVVSGTLDPVGAASTLTCAPAAWPAGCAPTTCSRKRSAP